MGLGLMIEVTRDTMTLLRKHRELQHFEILSCLLIVFAEKLANNGTSIGATKENYWVILA